MKIKNFVALTIIFLFFSFSCKETPPEPGNGIVNNGMLIVEDVGVTDAVIRLRVPRGFKSRSVILKRLPAEQAGDTTTIFHSPLSPATGGQATHHFLIDTLIIDEGLLPKHSYRYALTVNNFLNLQERSYADVVTMDTTSHEFTWQIDTLGDGHSSALYDVAILNDTLAYAVGEIKKKDSTGNYEYQPYNVARWDGKQWQLLKLEFPLYNYDCTVAGYLASKTTTIFGFNPNSILISDGGSVAKWDGATLTQYPCILNWITNGELLKIWGRSENDFYVVGRNGTILQYYFGTWQKLESGTDVNLTDVWGSPDGSVVWACGYFNNKRGTYLLRKNSDSWEVAYDGTSTEFNLLLETSEKLV
ncbi:MAG: hypothetical protein C0417_00245, partial [Chlorobiaceae bacterium]|nr:hypothetical protein [Chlorobiaceae bacterium]